MVGGGGIIPEVSGENKGGKKTVFFPTVGTGSREAGFGRSGVRTIKKNRDTKKR